MVRLCPDNTNFGARAPIREALVDLRVSESVGLESLEELATGLQARFGIERTTMFQWTGQLHLPATTTEERAPNWEHQSSSVRGFVLRDEAHGYGIQVRRDGFTYARLAPYRSWDDLRDSAKQLWEEYVGATNTTGVRRLGVRYINQVPLGPGEGAKEYLRNVPSPPQFAGHSMLASRIDCRMTFAHPLEASSAHVRTAIIRDGEGFALLFDISVALEAAGAVTWPVESASIWEQLDSLRDFKNDIFFASIKDEFKESLSGA